VEVENQTLGIDVFLDDNKLSPAVFGVELPLDPAEHDVVVVRNDGARLYQERVRVTAEGSKQSIKLDFDALDKAHPRKRPVPPKPPPPPPPQGKDSQRIAGFVVGGFGAAALLTAGGFEIAAFVKKGDANAAEACVNKFCTPKGLAEVQAARTFAEAGQWIGIGGLVAFAVGATLVLTLPPSPPPESRAGAIKPRLMWASPFVGPAAGGLVMGGAL
jgi:hypothetical protein